MKNQWALPAYSLCLVGAATLLYAQGERGTITGTVSDSTGAVIAEANAAVRNVATNVTQRTQSNSSGL
ncbi:MAG: carboxypeptidase regulatory-like domain-containing protein [Acidobacteria bacterium]|nr:carboxypeptidase regulatory-like domain-containing protein [Acidobacteriota bacterium]